MTTFKEHIVHTLRTLADQVENDIIICYSWNTRNEADEYTGDITDIILKAKFNIDSDYGFDGYDDGDGGASVIEKLNDMLKNKEVEANGE